MAKIRAGSMCPADFKVLIVDDEKLNRKLLGVIMTQEGYHVMYAKNGQEAIDSIMDCLESEPVDVMLLDLMMPVINGLDVLKILSEKKIVPTLPVIVISVETDRLKRNNALNSGALDFINKPIDRGEIVSRLRTQYILKVVQRELYIANFELKALNSTLALQVSEQAEKLITKTNLVAIGEMAGSVAHEINTPLGVLKLLIGKVEKLIAKLEASDKHPGSDIKGTAPDLLRINEMIKDMDKAVDRIAGVIRGLRSISRDGSTDPFVVVSLKHIIEDVINLVNLKFSNHGVDLCVESFSSDIKINCREVEIGQVILNFLSNAYDAVEKLEKKWVQLKVRSGQDQVEIEITDSGDGISEVIAQKIFLPFFTTKGAGKGTGLGLSISKRILNFHGGSVRINSSCPNTQFILTLPMVS